MSVSIGGPEAAGAGSVSGSKRALARRMYFAKQRGQLSQGAALSPATLNRSWHEGQVAKRGIGIVSQRLFRVSISLRAIRWHSSVESHERAQ
jgi:hypothetical protein